MVMTKEKALELIYEAQSLLSEVYETYGGATTTSALSGADTCIIEAIDAIYQGK